VLLSPCAPPKGWERQFRAILLAEDTAHAEAAEEAATAARS